VNKHEEKFLAGRAGTLQWCLWLILALLAACLFDYFIEERAHALSTLVLGVVLIAGFALWRDRSGHREAIKRDREDTLLAAQIEARREERLRQHGFR
jgi:hypothetical protein